MPPPTRWLTDTASGHSQRLVEHFRRLAKEGRDLAGEARFVDAMLPPGSTILDAGCGTGRVGAALVARGHTVVGVDVDPVLLEAAHEDFPGIEWLHGDLTELDAALGDRQFDAAVLAGNVMPFLAPDTEVDVLRNVAAHVRPDAPVIIGFGRERGYAVADFDAHVAGTGLRVEHRFATWDLRPWHPDADFAVTVLRQTGVSSAA